MVVTEMKADHLEEELTHDSESQQGASTTKRRSPSSKSKHLVTREVQCSSRVEDKAHLQGYNFGFDK